ncbi:MULTISPECIES: hypothetical protein [Clostridium]|jgi:hypothetical protein|uniref:Uncharacterized protein n=1 Tax=Clostridium aciditolerans TaxID=339861 RepID=A0A934HRZ6_9CLOT|nr:MULTISPECIES: hypothetical protein [Clostridium]MBI6873411.1 hypothetical protein [Clostridium aciditolerans]
MQSIKNSSGKLVCRIDSSQKIVEIVHKGIRTVIRFLDDGTYEVKNNEVIKIA